MKTQVQIASDLISEAQSDGHEIDLGPADMLDYMGILGVSFVESTEASREYIESIGAST